MHRFWNWGKQLRASSACEPHKLMRSLLSAFANRYLRALKAARVTFAEVVRKNIAKTRGRFIEPDYGTLPTFERMF
jgi:hypothetical protein